MNEEMSSLSEIHNNYEKENNKPKHKKIIIVILLVIAVLLVLFLLIMKDSKTYVVTFNNEGKKTTYVIKQNDVIKEPKIPLKKGYEFVGWYSNGKLYNFSSKVNKNIILVAKFKKVNDENSEEPDDPVIVTTTQVEDKYTTQKKDNNVTTTKKPAQNVTTKATQAAPVTTKPATTTTTTMPTTTKKKSYYYQIAGVPGSTTGQCYIYIKDENGITVSGSLTITYTNGGSETISISSSGYMIPNSSSIASISNVSGS